MYRYFENLVNPFADPPSGTPPGTIRAYMRQQLQPFRRVLPWMVAVSVLVAVVEAGLIFYSGRLIDLMDRSGAKVFWRENALELAFAAAFILLLRPAILTLQHLFLEQTLAGNMMDQSRWQAHRHMLGQSRAFFQNDFAGRLSNRVLRLGEAAEDMAYMALEAIWYAVSYTAGSLIVLNQIDPRVALPLALWVVIYIWFVRYIATRVGKASEKMSEARSMLNGRIVDAYANIDTVKLFAHAEREETYALSALKRHRLRFQRFLRLMTDLVFGLVILESLLIVMVVGPALWLWSRGVISVGEVAAAAALSIRMNAMTGWIMWVTIQLFERAGTMREGLQSVSVPHSVVDAEGAGRLVVARGEIRFRDVSHHYGKGHGGLDRIDLVIRPGEKVGLVGRSGAGKSSLVNLLLRFQDPEAGTIEIDGQDLAAVTQDSLRSQIGMVTQDSSLLHRSVRANILYGRPEAPEEELFAAAKRAEAHDFILDLRDPNGRAGYEAHVGERGVKLSGGQRQRVALARVILKNAPILVLDEATSALDSEVEAAIQSTLYGVMEGKTVIAIAHRLSTIARMDRIIVLDNGRIAEQGSHAELLAAEGLYAGFWNRQSGGFLQDEDDEDQVAAE